MADALIVADVVESLDAELLCKCTSGLVRGRALLVGHRRAVIEHHYDSIGMVQLPDLAPARRYEHGVDEHDRVDFHRNEIAGTDPRLAGLPGQDLFCKRHAHAGSRGARAVAIIASYLIPAGNRFD